MNNIPRVFLKAKEENEIKQGFPWVFDNEIDFVKSAAESGKIVELPLADTNVSDGSAVEVYSKTGLFLGTGIINRKSKITIRLLSKDKLTFLIAEKFSTVDANGKKSMANAIIPDGFNNRNVFDVEFFKARIEQALAIRFLYYKKPDSYRLIYGEADFIPGLIVERYCDESLRVFLVIQFLSLSVEVFRDAIVEALNEVCHPFGIYERSDASVREKEGLTEQSGWIGAEHDPVITIRENGVSLTVDLAKGQKTGYFLDQKDNRRRVAHLAKGLRVLDTFTHTGAFGLNAVAGGAKEVISVDISEEAVELVNSNIQKNNASHVMKAVCADVFDLLKQYEKQGEKFDMIILDPPAFTKSAKMIEKAYGGYKEINLRAMRLLKKGGILVSCSCSYFFNADTFYGMIMHAAMDDGLSVQILEKRGAGPDHPILSGYPKSDYLTCAIMRVL